MKTNTTHRLGFTLVEIMIVVAVIGLLAAIAIPNFVRARTRSQTNVCINNLRRLDWAKQQWALENKASDSATPATTQVQPYLGRGSVGTVPNPICPVDDSPSPTTDSSYVLNALSSPPTCISSGGTAANGHVVP